MRASPPIPRQGRSSPRGGRWALCAGLTLFCMALGAAPAVLNLPNRGPHAPTGSEFAANVATLPLAEREKEIHAQVISGNVPTFLRKLCAVRIAGNVDGQPADLVLYATPDYLAIGSDDDYLLMPMTPGTGQAFADALGCSLPTRRIVDQIYAAAELKLTPCPIPPSPAMTTVLVFSNHNALVRQQREASLKDRPLGVLVAGHKKDVVISPKCASSRGKVAIYGWHGTNGLPIQPLYLGHTQTWVDYSQCVRLVANEALLNGQPTNIACVLTNPALCSLISDEGVFLTPRYPVLSQPASPTSEPTARELGHRTSATDEERSGFFPIDPDARAGFIAPKRLDPGIPVLLIVYALPNGNTIEQTWGKSLGPGDDWHFDIQHIAAQSRFLRERLREFSIVVACVESAQRSWPSWRKQHGDQAIPRIVSHIQETLGVLGARIVLAGHSGGGSFIFGYLNCLETVPNDVVRIAFLDANYGYDPARGHGTKLAQWLATGQEHVLCMLAYDDESVLYQGKPLITNPGSGTWGRTHQMQKDFAERFTSQVTTNGPLVHFWALSGRLQSIVHQNPDKKILHTVQVERNGFIHSLLVGTPHENVGYTYFGPRAYTNYIRGD